MKKKKEKPEILWYVSFNYKESTTPIADALYTVQKDGRYFKVMYHGNCAVHCAETLEQAKDYVKKDLEKFGMKITN